MDDLLGLNSSAAPQQQPQQQQQPEDSKSQDLFQASGPSVNLDLNTLYSQAAPAPQSQFQLQQNAFAPIQQQQGVPSVTASQQQPQMPAIRRSAPPPPPGNMMVVAS